jgi:signal transduction histidine kinase
MMQFAPIDDDKSEKSDEGDSFRNKATIIRRAAHDLKGDFLGLTTMCKILEDNFERNEDQTSTLKVMREAFETYKYNLSNFLEYIRFDAGVNDSLHEPVNIWAILSSVALSYETVAAEKNTAIDFSIADDIPKEIIGDEFRIAQVVTNLLSNAIKFSPPDSLIEVRVKREKGTKLVVTVEDQGVGMSNEQLTSIFELEPSKRKLLKNPGGLGLIVTRYLVEDVLGGKITVSSELELGTIFKVWLPLE